MSLSPRNTAPASADPGSSTTLVELLERRAASDPDLRGFSFLVDGESTEEHLTYAELDARARSIAAALIDRGASGGRALLLYPPGLDYVAAFFGCLYANVVAVPAYPPDPSRLERTIPRLVAIVEDAQATVALTTSPLLQLGEMVFAGAPRLKTLTWLATDGLPATPGKVVPPIAPTADSLAFLQYTSGSTGSPKGVMLTHRNLLHNEALIHRAFGHDERSIVVGWLPLYHDMGLIGNLLQPLYVGIPCVLMSPIAFLQRPLRWLQAISKYRATTSGGPNFAYDLCVRKTTEADRAALDLSSWRLAFNGAEPVRPETLKRFAAAFAGSGFREQAFYPCYGLAEGTLIVSGGTVGEGAVVGGDDERRLVGAGRALGDQQVLIVDPETRVPCAPRAVGEIWVKGGSVAQGYWQRSDATEETFLARLASGEGLFLRTGDLGFLDGGELFVTGRRKDLIILRGRNVYPQDLEQTVERLHPALRPGCGAAFSVELEGLEQAVIVFELDLRAAPDVERLLAAIVQTVADEHEVQLAAVVLIKPGSIPKTSSGKIQRRATRDELLAGRLDVIAAWKRAGGTTQSSDTDEPSPLPDGIVGEMLRVVAEVMDLPVTSLDAQTPISQYGMDSLVATQLASRVRDQFQVELPLRAIFDAPSVATLAAQVGVLRREGAQLDGGIAPVPHDGELPLSFAQERYWVLTKQDPTSARFHLGGEMRIAGELDVAALGHALSDVVARHQVLAMRFPERDGRPFGLIARDWKPSIEWIDLRALGDEAREERASALLHHTRTSPFSIDRGPLLRVVGLHCGERDHRLVVVVHHLVFDGWSEALFIDELARAYRRAREQTGPAAPPSLQYVDFAAWQRKRMSTLAEAQLGYWKEQLALAPAEIALPADRGGEAGAQGAVKRVTLKGWRPRLAQKRRSSGATDFVLLLAAFKGLLQRVSGQSDLVVGTVLADRNRAELEGLIGCFVNFVALRTEVDPDGSWAALVDAVKETVRGAQENQAIPFEQVVRSLGGARGSMPLYNVGFLLQSLPSRSGELGDGLELEVRELERNEALLDLRVEVRERGDDLLVGWEYRKGLFSDETIASLAEAYAEALTQVVDGHAALVGKLVLPERLRSEHIAVAATFTADPVRDALRFWARNHGERVRVEFAPYGQVFQSLLEEDSVLRAADPGHNVLLVRFGDLGPQERAALLDTTRELADAIAFAAGKTKRSWLVVHCPESPEKAAWSALHLELEAQLAERLSTLSGVVFVPAAELLALYPVARWHDPSSEALGKIPYTEELYAALGTLIARKRAAMKRAPYKVIALDCDETLWRGVCGEDGALGVRPRGWLQDFLLEQKRKGMLLCLCSKNEEADVFEVFERNAEMKLRRGDLVATKINWRSKADNLEELGRELGLGLDSFIFVDDNPRECAEVAARHPEVLVVELPKGDEAELERFFHHVWGFDRVWVTKEDERRTELYLENAERSRAAKEAPTLASFLARLDLKVEIRELTKEDYERAAQLTQRTNQFNLSGTRRQAAEVAEYLGRPGQGGWVVEVRDRFGDYGQVGVVLYVLEAEALVVDTLLLSCRVLGKGVEHRVLNRLGQAALELGKAEVDLPFVATKKNQPAKSFLEQTVAAHRRGAGYAVPAAVAEAVRYQAERASEQPVEQESPGPTKLRREEPAPQQTGIAWQTAAQVLTATRAHKVGHKATSHEFVAPSTSEEKAIAGLWAELLGLPRVGVHDNFFELGGDSIQGVQLISRIRSVLGVELPMEALFGEASTVAQQALRLVELRREGKLAAPPIERSSLPGPVPLSYAQERIWFLAQLDPLSAAYNESAYVRLSGALDVGALEASVNDVIARHEVLRTRFVKVDGVPHQEIAPSLRIAIELKAAKDEAEAEQAAREEAKRPFDLAADPLVRVTLWQLAGAEHLVLFTLHHIVSDGWSLGVLVRELGALYRARSTGETASLPELPIQYADYARWQRVSGESLDTQLDYWRKQLSGATTLMLQPDTPVGTAEGGEISLVLPTELASGLRALARQENATPFMVMLAASQLTLGRLSGTHDVVVGSPIANRDRTELEPLIGLFLNTLVLRTDLSGSPSFRALLSRVRETTLGAYAHQEVPFEKLVTELKPQRSASGNPFFDVLVNGLPAETVPLSLPGLRSEAPRRDGVEAKYPITLYTSDDGSRWTVRLAYQKALFSDERMRELAAQLEAVLGQVMGDADRPIDRYSLVSERATAIVARGDGPGPVEEPQPLVVDEVRARASERGQATAVRCGAVRLSYAELVERGEAVAQALHRQGLDPADVVGVIGERGCGVVTSLFGVWAAGGVLQPMERSQPRPRQEAMAAASGLRGIVLVGDLPAEEVAWLSTLARWVVRVGSDGQLIDPPATTAALLPRRRGEDAAYVFFTSGTTGTPKGVLGEHRGVSHFVRWQRAEFEIGPTDRAAQLTGMGFNVLLRDVWTPLISGAELVVPPPTLGLGTRELVEWLASEQITVVHTVPSVMEAWLKQRPDGLDLPHLRWVFSAGEALRDGLVKRWRAAFPGAGGIVVVYGQTESTLAKTFYRVPIDLVPGPQAVGRPLPGVEVLLLRDDGAPCGIGEPGEVVMRTPYRTRGYLNASDEQARKFRVNPRTGRADDVLYYTGDRGRLRADGNLELLGRMDLQLKVRGVRVEVGEIESCLGRHPDVEQVVVAVATLHDEPSLWGYVVRRPASTLSDEALRRWMRGQVPDALQPTGYVFLEALPRGKNGKVDRAALPAPVSRRDEATQVAPRTELEEQLATIWKNLLKLERVGIHDNFFELGGHSLLATQLVSQVRKVFGVEVPIRGVFDAPTLEALATTVETQRKTAGGRSSPVVRPASWDKHRRRTPPKR